MNTELLTVRCTDLTLTVPKSWLVGASDKKDQSFCCWECGPKLPSTSECETVVACLGDCDNSRAEVRLPMTSVDFLAYLTAAHKQLAESELESALLVADYLGDRAMVEKFGQSHHDLTKRLGIVTREDDLERTRQHLYRKFEYSLTMPIAEELGPIAPALAGGSYWHREEDGSLTLYVLAYDGEKDPYMDFVCLYRSRLDAGQEKLCSVYIGGVDMVSTYLDPKTSRFGFGTGAVDPDAEDEDGPHWYQLWDFDGKELGREQWADTPKLSTEGGTRQAVLRNGYELWLLSLKDSRNGYVAELNAEGQRKAILATTRPIIYYDKYKVLIKFGTGNYGFRYYREAVKAGKKVVAWQDLEPLAAPELELQTDDHGYLKSSFEEVEECPELLVSEKYSQEVPGLVTWTVLDMYFD